MTHGEISQGGGVHLLGQSPPRLISPYLSPGPSPSKTNETNCVSLRNKTRRRRTLTWAVSSLTYYSMLVSRSKSKRNYLSTPSLKLGKSRSNFSLSLTRRCLVKRQESSNTTSSIRLKYFWRKGMKYFLFRSNLGTSNGRSSPTDPTDSFKKSETSFTKRNIKSQVCLHSLID